MISIVGFWMYKGVFGVIGKGKKKVMLMYGIFGLYSVWRFMNKV